MFALDQRVLGILSRVSRYATQMIDHGGGGGGGGGGGPGMTNATCATLVVLLVPYLRESHRLRDSAKKDILDTIAALAPFLDDATPHLTLLFMLLLPGRRAMDGLVRASLVSLLLVLGQQRQTSWLVRHGEGVLWILL